MIRNFMPRPGRKLVAFLLATGLHALLVLAAEKPIESPEPPSGWVAKRVFDPFRNESRCVVESAHQKIHDGYQDTTVYLRVDAKALRVVTESNLDLRKPDFGLLVDKHKFMRPDRTYLEQSAVFESGIETILAQFKAGRIVTLKLHFWPTWPSKGLKTVRYSLTGFGHAFARLPAC